MSRDAWDGEPLPSPPPHRSPLSPFGADAATISNADSDPSSVSAAEAAAPPSNFKLLRRAPARASDAQRMQPQTAAAAIAIGERAAEEADRQYELIRARIFQEANAAASAAANASSSTGGLAGVADADRASSASSLPAALASMSLHAAAASPLSSSSADRTISPASPPSTTSPAATSPSQAAHGAGADLSGPIDSTTDTGSASSTSSGASVVSVNGSVRIGARHPAVAKTAAQHRIIAEITAAEKSAAEKSGADSSSSAAIAANDGSAGLASTPAGYDTAHDPEYGPAARRSGRGGGFGGYRGGGGRGGGRGGGGGDLAYSQYAQYQPSVATQMHMPVPSPMHAAQQQQQQQQLFQQQQLQQQRQLAAMQMASGALFAGGGVSSLHANAAPYYPQSALPISMQQHQPPPFFHAGMQVPFGGAYGMPPQPYPPHQMYPQQQQQQPPRAPPNLNEDFPSLGAQRKS